MKTTIRKQESEFKAETIKRWLDIGHFDRVFCIESDETVPGFPDCLCHDDDGFHLYEFKSSDERGDIKFKKTQPRFYLQNKCIDVAIIAFDNRNGKTHVFPASDLFDASSQYRISKSFTVRLPL